jgi:hypothetical protein
MRSIRPGVFGRRADLLGEPLLVRVARDRVAVRPHPRKRVLLLRRAQLLEPAGDPVDARLDRVHLHHDVLALRAGDCQGGTAAVPRDVEAAPEWHHRLRFPLGELGEAGQVQLRLPDRILVVPVADSEVFAGMRGDVERSCLIEQELEREPLGACRVRLLQEPNVDAGGWWDLHRQQLAPLLIRDLGRVFDDCQPLGPLDPPLA